MYVPKAKVNNVKVAKILEFMNDPKVSRDD